MPLPIATPLHRSDPSADRIAALVLRLEEDLSPSLTLTTLAARHIGGDVQAYVIAHLGDGSREKFTASEARLAAEALRDAAGPIAQVQAWADSMDDAADTAERQASAVLLGMAAGRNVTPMHPYWRGRA